METCSEYKNLNIVYKNLTYTPPTSIQINTNFVGTLEYEVTKNNIGLGAKLNITAWYQTKDDHWFSTQLDLCEDTSVECPLKVGKHQFTTKKLLIPYLPKGLLLMEMKTIYNNVVEGCAFFKINVTDQIDPPKRHCIYTSQVDFSAFATGAAQYSSKSISWRDVGDYLQVGDLGQYTTGERGKFTKIYSTPDNTFGEELSSRDYHWCINATITNIFQIVNGSNITYEGDFWIGSKSKNLDTWDEFLVRGNLFLNGVWDNRTNQLINGSGILNAIPSIMIPKGFSGPVSFGKYNPMKYEYHDEMNIALLNIVKEFCQCPIDVCGVCGGDGSSCKPTPTPYSTPSPTPSTKKKGINTQTLILSIAIPVAAIILIVLIVVIARKNKKINSGESEPMIQKGPSGLNWEK
ncbi:hypothetical protein M0812_13757 [Anaeramoeba flamelloides]|uniref:Uncharacterized protein n=1 Tax=Anaeramoeba flamelloides TaxID=1746091 RepID=A0AAV7ZIB2_9EUKA|nr:hypothetical protein M0812_13757 [Anaeramoeba flamelloides]